MASLALSNKYLATRTQRLEAVYRTVASSSAIEGIHAPFKRPKTARAAAKPALASNPVKSKHA
jgi:hypothetical protein